MISMKKNKYKILIFVLVILIIVVSGSIIYRILQDENALTVTEKKYINDSHSTLLDINVLNDVNIFGIGGKGIYYDFLSDIEEEYSLNFNEVTTSSGAEVSGLTLTKGSSAPENSKIFYTDHFILISKNFKNIESINNIDGNIGILDRDRELIDSVLKDYKLTLTNYSSREELEDSFLKDEINYMLVPRIEYLDTVLGNLYNIVYHFSDLKDYYYLVSSDNEVLNSILKKYHNKWSEQFNESFYKNEYELFTSKLKITEKELDVINSKEYTYGFISNPPYDVKVGGTYGGVMSEYLNRFAKFSKITINYKDYKNITKLSRAISRGDVNLYTNQYNIKSDYVKIDSLYTTDISFVMDNKDTHTFNSLAPLHNYTIYVKDGSVICNYLKENGFNVKTYKKDRELKKLFGGNAIVAMDYLNYLIYKNDNPNVNERFRVSDSNSYAFLSNNDTMFNRLFTYYTMTIDKNEIMYNGIDSYNKTVVSGKLIYKITEYALILILVITCISYIIYRFGKKVHIKKRIKKTDKMKYIDMLTSIKNRNFLNENLPIWNQNTIYPQSVIVIDLNGVQELNDTYGYSEGDKQIQSLANILIKTQLDNTEIIRTDGNEFTIYMVGYNERQVLSYIKKLNREFKNLPHDKGAAVGFSMINDDLKLIDDAINEATEMMKKNKEAMNGVVNEEEV